MSESKARSLLVIGAGIAGISTALEAAEAGQEVVLVEKSATVGGRVLGLHHYFPKLCPPSCGMEINTRRLEKNPRIKVYTQTEVTSAEENNQNWTVKLTQKPLYVKPNCTACGACSKVCPSKVDDPYNLGMNQVPAIRLVHSNAWPQQFVMDKEACPEDCDACVQACKYNAIDLAASEREVTLNVDAAVIATGWRPYPLENLKELGGGIYDDVLSNIQFERMVADTGPTEGKIIRPSTGEPPKTIAFVQCAGSRDCNHLAHCSSVCCLASLKQAIFVKEQIPDAEVTIYYIDRRTPGRNEDLLTRVADMKGVYFVKGKVGKIDKDGDDLQLRVEDTLAGKILTPTSEMVVLATGMEPNLKTDEMPFELKLDQDGFGLDNLGQGIVVTGVARRPDSVAVSVRDATGAAAKACVAAARRAK